MIDFLKKFLEENVEQLERINNTVCKLQACMKGCFERKKYEKKSKDVMYREFVAREIYDTEIRYVDQLNLFIDLFMKPLFADLESPKPMLNENDFRTIFSCVEVILGYNTMLRNKIGKKIKK